MSRPSLNVKIYEQSGKSAAKKVRAEGLIPATVSNKGKTTNVLVEAKAFDRLLNQGIKESTLIDIDVPGGEETTAFIKSAQRNPKTREIESIQFYKVTFGEPIHTVTEIKFVGESKGVKMGGLMETFLKALKIECLPADMPDHIDVDISEMATGDVLHVSDLQPPKGVTILNEGNVLVAMVHAPKMKGVRGGNRAAGEEETEAAEPAEA